MQRIDNSIYNKDDLSYQDRQQAQVAACRDFYTDHTNNRMSVLFADEVEEPLERTRLYGPFALDVVQWAIMCKVTLGVDADGREYVEY
jgi:hypothetical protein